MGYYQLNGKKGHTSPQWIMNRELLCYTLLPPLPSLNLLIQVISTRFVDPGMTWAKEVLEHMFLGDWKDHLG